MSSQHKAPLAAFVVVSITCIVVLVAAVRSEAFSTFVERQTQAIVATVPMIPQPERVMVTEAHVVAKAKAGLQVTPQVVKQVVGSADTARSARSTSPSRHHKSRHHAAGVAASQTVLPAPAPVNAAVSTPAAPAPVAAPPVVSPVRYGHSGAAQQTPAVSVQPLASAQAQQGHRRDASPFAGKGWAGSNRHDQGHRSHGQAAQQASSVRPHGWSSRGSQPAVPSVSSWSAPGSSNGAWSGRGHGDSRGNSWSNGRENSWSNGRTDTHHGWR